MDLLLKKVQEIQFNYKDSIEKVGIKNLFNTQRMVQDMSFTEAREIIKNTRLIINNHLKMLDDNIDFLFNHIEESQNLTLVKKIQTKRLEKELDAILTIASKIWNMEYEIIHLMEKVIDLLASKKDEWDIENHEVLFYTDEIIDEFELYSKRIALLAEKQREVEKELLAAYPAIPNQLGDTGLKT